MDNSEKSLAKAQQSQLYWWHLQKVNFSLRHAGFCDEVNNIGNVGKVLTL